MNELTPLRPLPLLGSGPPASGVDGRRPPFSIARRLLCCSRIRRRRSSSIPRWTRECTSEAGLSAGFSDASDDARESATLPNPSVKLLSRLLQSALRTLSVDAVDLLSTLGSSRRRERRLRLLLRDRVADGSWVSCC